MADVLPQSPAAARAMLKDVLGSRRIPSFPRQHRLILDALAAQREGGQTKPLVEAISTDPAVSVRLLRVANSAAFGARRKVDSIHRAVVLLGHRRIESIVTALGAARAVPRHRVGPLDRKRFWAAATHRAAMARRLAEQHLPPAVSVAFTAALIADLAVPLLSGTRPRLYADFFDLVKQGRALERLERESLGWDHTDVAGWLAVSWELPASLAALVGRHHKPIDAGIGEDRLVQVAAAATGSVGTEPTDPTAHDRLIATCWYQLGLRPDQVRPELERPLKTSALSRSLGG